MGIQRESHVVEERPVRARGIAGTVAGVQGTGADVVANVDLVSCFREHCSGELNGEAVTAAIKGGLETAGTGVICRHSKGQSCNTGPGRTPTPTITLKKR
jgi:hypothetical protein